MKKTAPPQDTRLTLALNAAEGVLQIAFADARGALVYSQCVEAASRGAEMLAPSIERALELIGREPRDIAKIAAVAGPGSFTGLRLTAATAAGLARAVGAKQASLEYMPLLARQCLPGQPPAERAILCCLTRARRDLVYMQCFMRDPDSRPPFRGVTDLAVLGVASGETARRILAVAAGNGVARIFLAGTGAHENRDTLASQLTGPDLPRVTLLDVTHPMPDKLLAAALDADYGDADIEPLYARASDAEENLPQIAARLGLDPEAAVEKLRILTHTGPDENGG